MTTQGFPKILNGDVVVGFMNTKKVKELGWSDLSTLYSWYSDNPTDNHLGLIELFTNMADYRLPSYDRFFKKGAIIEVNGYDGKFTYDLPVTKSTGVYTTGDTSDYSDAPGVDGTVFPIELDQPFTSGDVLTYDAMYGEQVVVSPDYEVEQVGDAWVHWVTIVSFNPSSYFPKEKLKAGIQYFKVDHTVGEYTEEFSKIQSPNQVSSIRCEFQLGGHRGVETFYTMYADKKRISGASIQSGEFIDKFVKEMETMGVDTYGRQLDTFFVGKINQATKKVDPRTVRIGATLEYLVMLELMKLETYSLMFSKGGVINDVNGTKRMNEGYWHQIRRGYKIQYNQPGGISRAHIKAAVSYVHSGNKNLLPHQRRTKFLCGYQAYLNMLNIFREEVMMQLDGISQLIGHTTVLPKSPVSGANLTSLAFEPIMFKQVNIPEIGIVEIEHEPALDYLPLTDIRSAGMYGDGYTWSSYSMVIWDAASDEFSNAFSTLPASAKVVGKNVTENIYYVKPEGQNMYWGYANGRYAPDKAGDINSSLKVMGREFWAHVASSSWVKDVSRYVFIELKR